MIFWPQTRMKLSKIWRQYGWQNLSVVAIISIYRRFRSLTKPGYWLGLILTDCLYLVSVVAVHRELGFPLLSLDFNKQFSVDSNEFITIILMFSWWLNDQHHFLVHVNRSDSCNLAQSSNSVLMQAENLIFKILWTQD